MITDNLMPLTCLYSPPENDQKAEERVGEYCGISLSGLTGMVFKSIDQLTRALSASIKFNMSECKTIVNGGDRAKCHILTVVGTDGTTYVLAIEETYIMSRIIAVQLKKAGSSVNKEAKVTFEDLLSSNY